MLFVIKLKALKVKDAGVIGKSALLPVVRVGSYGTTCETASPSLATVSELRTCQCLCSLKLYRYKLKGNVIAFTVHRLSK